jgi:hypothetical protein
MDTRPRIDGSWSLVISTPRGDRPATLALEQDGSTITGRLDEVPIEDGTWANGTLTFSAQLTEPVKVKVKCTMRIEGDSMAGTAKAAWLPLTVKLSGSRVIA